MMISRRRYLLTAALAITLVGAVASSAQAAPGSGSQESSSPVRVATSSEAINPDGPEASRRAASDTPDAQAERYQRLLDLREHVDAAQPQPEAAAAAAVEVAPGPETQVAAESEVTNVRKNFRNTVATSVSSTLAEPAAAVDGREVLYAGNTYLSRSTNSGSSWTNMGAYPAGPSDAPFPCCDADIVHHAGTDTTFNIMLYTDSAVNNGVIRIFVRKGSTGTLDCSYTIDPGGTANNLLPDYPHLGVSNGYLYLTTNNITSGSWSESQVRRFKVSQMSKCLTTTTNTFTYVGSVGQRVFTPVEGAKSVMFWGSLDSATTFRIFRWPESTTTVTQLTRSVGASAFNNPDCGGGTGDFDYIERSTSFSITGFRMRGAVAGTKVLWLWHSSPIGSQPQAHLRGIAINASTSNVLAQPVVWNASNCIGYPALGGNADGEFALSVAFGGNKEPGGTAAQGTVGIDDSSSTGISFPTVSITATGTHNRSDGRYGDYFTVRNSDRCAKTWVATNYALLNGNTSAAHVNARYVEVQSSTEPSCPA